MRNVTVVTTSRPTSNISALPVSMRMGTVSAIENGPNRMTRINRILDKSHGIPDAVLVIQELDDIIHLREPHKEIADMQSA
jgi:hypothetical protein